MHLIIEEEKTFNYIEEGEGEVLLLLHGLFGALSNWEHVLGHFSKKYKVIIPLIPIYELPLKKSNIEGLVEFINSFIAYKKLKNFTIIGNSLGGHLALVYTLQNPHKVNKLVLTGSSGLYENSMGGSFIKRSNYEYIAERVRYTFYDPNIVTREYIDEVFKLVQDNSKVLRIVAMAKSAQRNNLATKLPTIKTSTLLIWGSNDPITPAAVAHEFNDLIPNSQLFFINKCCHVPMMEHPEEFNQILERFLLTEKI